MTKFSYFFVRFGIQSKQSYFINKKILIIQWKFKLLITSAFISRLAKNQSFNDWYGICAVCRKRLCWKIYRMDSICRLTICRNFNIFILSAVKFKMLNHDLPTHDLPKGCFNHANGVLTTCNDRQYWRDGRAKVCER